MSAPCLPYTCYSCYLSNLCLPVWYQSSLSAWSLPTWYLLLSSVWSLSPSLIPVSGPCLPDTCYYYLSGLCLPVWYPSSCYLPDPCLLATWYLLSLLSVWSLSTYLLVICFALCLSAWYLLLLSVWSLSTCLPDTQETVFFCNVRTMFQVVPMRINGAGTNQLHLKDFASFLRAPFRFFYIFFSNFFFFLLLLFLCAGRDLLPF